MLTKLCTAVLLLAATAAGAQDSSKLSFTAFVDAYYRYNLSNPKSPVTNDFTSFTNSQNSFELGMASLKVEHSGSKAGFVADLGVGKRAEEFSYNDDRSGVIIKQAYVYYTPAERLKLTGGSWATHIGYEMVDPALNRNYSMSYMFSYGPFFHTGIKAEYATKGKSAFMVGLADPTDLKSASFSRKFLIGQWSTATLNDKYKLFVNYQGGTNADRLSKIQQLDVVGTGTLTDKLSLGYNGTVQWKRGRDTVGKSYDASRKWWGSALYANYDPKASLGLTLRHEYFCDNRGLIFGVDKSCVNATTLSLNYKVGGLTIIPELRLDAARQNIFVNGDGEAKKSTVSALVAVVYQFKR